MAESVARSSTTSASSAAKRRVSKSAEKADPAGGRARKERTAELLYQQLFHELARVAEMSLVERRLHEAGFRSIAGTDEVGRGCLAGPVVAACVILDGDGTIVGVNDSKQISHLDRLEVCRSIMSRARAVAVGIVEPRIIDTINILQASKLAMYDAVENLPVRPDVLLLDAVLVESLEMPQIPLIRGDQRSVSIAAASIVAKVYRDLLMESYHVRYPVYDFVNNRGYGTESHWAALRTYGPSPIHRRSFEGVTEPMLLFGRGTKDGGSER